jgi:hypothetical protein
VQVRLTPAERSWLAEWLRATGPRREAPTAYNLADRLESDEDPLHLNERESAEVLIAVDRALEDHASVPAGVLDLRDECAR